MSHDFPDRSRLPEDACEDLCTKALYLASDDPDIVEDDARIETADWWCCRNQMPFGPDGKEVTPETCRPGRPCCSPRLSAGSARAQA